MYSGPYSRAPVRAVGGKLPVSLCFCLSSGSTSQRGVTLAPGYTRELWEKIILTKVERTQTLSDTGFVGKDDVLCKMTEGVNDSSSKTLSYSY